jgi:hypothetical protein
LSQKQQRSQEQVGRGLMFTTCICISILNGIESKLLLFQRRATPRVAAEYDDIYRNSSSFHDVAAIIDYDNASFSLLSLSSMFSTFQRTRLVEFGGTTPSVLSLPQ